MGPVFAKILKDKNQAKKQCDRYKGSDKKKCILKIEIQALRKKTSEVRKSIPDCIKAKDDTKKRHCRAAMNEAIKNYNKKIKKKQTEISKLS